MFKSLFFPDPDPDLNPDPKHVLRKSFHPDSHFWPDSESIPKYGIETQFFTIKKTISGLLPDMASRISGYRKVLISGNMQLGLY